MTYLFPTRKGELSRKNRYHVENELGVLFDFNFKLRILIWARRTKSITTAKKASWISKIQRFAVRTTTPSGL
jgi:hypothetical protein